MGAKLARCPGCGAARNEVERCAADPGPPRTVTIHASRACPTCSHLSADASGSGPKVLLLPALSSISSRREIRPLQERLAPRYSTLAADWPGFGDAARPQMDWTPDAYAAFLAFLLSSVMAQPHAIIA